MALVTIVTKVFPHKAELSFAPESNNPFGLIVLKKQCLKSVPGKYTIK